MHPGPEPARLVLVSARVPGLDAGFRVIRLADRHVARKAPRYALPAGRALTHVKLRGAPAPACASVSVVSARCGDPDIEGQRAAAPRSGSEPVADARADNRRAQPRVGR